jgi:hypothetical protein
VREDSGNVNENTNEEDKERSKPSLLMNQWTLDDVEGGP